MMRCPWPMPQQHKDDDDGDGDKGDEEGDNEDNEDNNDNEGDSEGDDNKNDNKGDRHSERYNNGDTAPAALPCVDMTMMGTIGMGGTGTARGTMTMMAAPPSLPCPVSI